MVKGYRLRFKLSNERRSQFKQIKRDYLVEEASKEVG